MLKLDLPFSIVEEPRRASFVRGVGRSIKVEQANLWLKGLSISIEVAGRSYVIVSEQTPQPDRPGPFQGAIWPRCVLPLPAGTAIEQQMMLPAAGDAIVMSWRLLARCDRPATLRVSPTFTATKRFAPTLFCVEAETDGGRLTWRPFPSSSKIIADTNGRSIDVITPLGSTVAPVTFEFELGKRPAILILRSELAAQTSLNPLIGGFLAALTREREHFDQRGLQNRLAA